MNLIEDRPLTANFMLSEFACHDGCGFCTTHPQLAPSIQNLRDIIALPIVIISGCRCPTQNRLVGGAAFSQHLQGNAADLGIRGIHPLELYRRIITIPAFRSGGVGIGNGIVHVDVYQGMNTRRWSYDPSGSEVDFTRWEFYRNI